MNLQPVDFISGLGGQQNLPNPFVEQEQATQAAQQDQAGRQQLALGAAKLSAIAGQAAHEQAYQNDVAETLRNPTPANFAALMAHYPDQAQALKAAWDAQDEPTKQANLSQLGGIYASLANGKPDLAVSSLQARIDAEKKAGLDTSDDEQILQLLQSGDPRAVDAAKGIAGYHLATALGPDKFSETLSKLGLDASDGGSTVVGPGGALVEKGTGKVLYKAADAPRYEKVDVFDASGQKIGEKLIQVGGGGSGAPGVGGQPVAGRTAGGWTPRIRNGGDNPDDAVDNKIAGVAQALGVDPDADISTLPPGKIAQALSFGEGGAGTLADRNNNPTNLRNGDGSYKTFANPQQGITAASALVARKLKNGQTTVRTLIEGLPAGGVQPQATGANVVYSSEGNGTGIPGDPNKTGPDYIATLPNGLRQRVQAILDTRAPYPTAAATRSAQGQALMNAVNQADPTFDAAAWKRRADTIHAYSPGGDQGKAMTSAATLINHLYEMADAAQQLPDHSLRMFNSIANAGASATNAPWLIKFNESRKFVSSELPKFLTGKAPTEGEVTHNYESYSPSLGKSGIKEAVGTDIDYLYGRFQPLLQAYKDNTGTDLNLDNYAPSQATKAKAAALDYYRANGVLPKVVSSPAQAKGLPKGTVVVTPDGRIGSVK